jgi:hypothetical protein
MRPIIGWLLVGLVVGGLCAALAWSAWTGNTAVPLVLVVVCAGVCVWLRPGRRGL